MCSTEMGASCDWQISKQKISERSQYLFETGQWSDCKFIVGEESDRETLNGHKLLLAMSSPVFEAMFYGGLSPIKDDSIEIRDVQPQAFKALLKYIYTDSVSLGSFELACELCYCAKKYMLPALVEECTKFLWSDLSPSKACRAYEFAKLFEEPILMEKCWQIICRQTKDVLQESSWEEIEIGTLMSILDQDELEVNTEAELFHGLNRWAAAECRRKSLAIDRISMRTVIGDALLKIRFLTLNPQEFATACGTSVLLTQDECYAILMNILCGGKATPMPEGFSKKMISRVKPQPELKTYNTIEESYENRHIDMPLMEIMRRDIVKYYCHRMLLQTQDCLNTSVLDCSVTFSVDKNVSILGIQVPTQIGLGVDAPPIARCDIESTYTEVLYAYLLDANGSRLTYTHFTTRAESGTLLEIAFNHSVYIRKHKVYRVGVTFNKPGWYPLGICTEQVACDVAFFSFGVGNSADSIRDGLIRSIVFTH